MIRPINHTDNAGFYKRVSQPRSCSPETGKDWSDKRVAIRDVARNPVEAAALRHQLRFRTAPYDPDSDQDIEKLLPFPTSYSMGELLKAWRSLRCPRGDYRTPLPNDLIGRPLQ